MAYYSIFPEKDATIYSNPDRDTLNTGRDEILELIKEKGDNNNIYYPSRILLKFNNSELEDVIYNKIGVTTNQAYNGINPYYSASLQLFSTEHQNLASQHSIFVHKVSESWDEGTGRYLNLPTSSNGVSWKFKDNDITKTSWLTSSFSEESTGSIRTIEGLNPGGGTWYTSSLLSSSLVFNNARDLDLNFDITSIVEYDIQKLSSKDETSTLLDEAVQGYIIKYADSIEENISSSKGTLSYFSVDTHTIFPPKLTFKWDDSLHNSQSLAKNKGELNVSLYRNKDEYNINEEATLRLSVRDKYPNRTFATSSNYLTPGYFTTSSFYSIRDAHTEEIIIPFDNNCTKLSADSEGMYLKIYMNGLQPERYYRLLFKHINNEGIEIFDNNYHFKVVR